MSYDWWVYDPNATSHVGEGNCESVEAAKAAAIECASNYLGQDSGLFVRAKVEVADDEIWSCEFPDTEWERSKL